MAKLGELTVTELISSARSELSGLREHLKMTDLVSWDTLAVDEQYTRAYLVSIEARLSILDIKLRAGEK